MNKVVRVPRLGRFFVTVGLACGLGLAATGPARAEDGSTTAVAMGSRNVYVAGGQVQPLTAVAGDFAAAGGKVTLNQAVGGDATLAGGSVHVRAPVGDDLRTAGGDVNIESTVGGELLAFGANIMVDKAATVARGANLYGSNVDVRGRVDGPLTAVAQKIVIDAEIGGDVHLTADQIELGPHARIGGALRYLSSSELKKAEAATISGTVLREQRDAAPPDRRGEWQRPMQTPFGAGGAVSYLALLACAAVLLLLMPTFADRASARIGKSPGLTLAVGLGTAAAVPVLALLLVITILGIPLALALFALYPVLWLAGFVVAVLFVARAIPARLHRAQPRSFAASFGYFALALLIVHLLAKVPFAGGVLLGVLSLAGVGAALLELYERLSTPKPPDAAGQADLVRAA